MPPPPQRPAGDDFRGPRSIYRQPDTVTLERTSIVRILCLCLLGIVGLFAAGATFLAVSPPTGLIKDRIVAEVKARTGRDLTIAGKARFTFVPELGVTLENVALSAPPTMPGPPLITADGMDVRLALAPLIMREIKVERLVLQRPVIDLRVDANGRRNWDFAEADPLRVPGPRFAQAATRPDTRKDLQDFAKNASTPQPISRKSAPLESLTLGDVRIVDGTLRYADQRQGRQHEVKGIDAKLVLGEFAGPFQLTGKLDYAGEPLSVDARLASLKDAVDERPTEVTIKLSGRPVDASYRGLVASGGASASLDGRVSLKAPSAAALARLVTLPLAGLDALGAIAVEGQLKTGPTSVSLNDASLALGETAAKGSLSVDTAGARPLVKANLRFAVLDLNKLSALSPTAVMPMPVGGAAPPLPAASSPAPGSGSPAAPAQSIEDLLRRSDGTAVRGFTKRTGDNWSQDPISPGPLRLVDLDTRFEIGQLLWDTLKIGQTQATVQLKAGVLKANVTDAELYGGRAKGLISVDGRDHALVVGINLSGDGVQALPFLRDAGGFDLLEGRGRLVVAVSAKGGSERELVGSLNGRAEVLMADGALVGWDASQMLAGLGQGRMPSLDRAQSAKTPFSVMSGSFQIANGVARNQDLKLESAVLKATGSGLVNLVDRNVDMTVRPKAATIPGAGQLAGLEIPVRIAGPWDKPTIIPDVAGALKSPQAIEAAKQIGKQLQNGNVDGALRGVLGNDPKADEKVGKAKEMLRQFLNR